jgi:hypothetical protein
MRRSTNKLPFFLLALTLLFSPLQSALAGLDFHASGESGQHNMHHTDASAARMDAGQMMSADCQHCTEQNGCNHHNCSHSHCTSCTPGLLGFFQLDLATRGTDLYQQVNQILLKHFTAHPYRPPKV